MAGQMHLIALSSFWGVVHREVIKIEIPILLNIADRTFYKVRFVVSN